MDFSIMFFSHLESDVVDQYRMMQDISRIGDEYGFKAVWLPERHFNPMGGGYPNPAVLAASLAVQTKSIRLRAGSVILPLHHPAEVAESWAVVDQLSKGRVDLAFASGWNHDDFILAPDIYSKLREEWLKRIPVVQKLWRGEKVRYPNGKQELIEISTFPRPVQPNLNTWLAISKQIDSFRIAGEMGYNILTMLTGISLEQLSEKINIYRASRESAGFDPATGIVSLMLHTYIHQDEDYVRSSVTQPFFKYLKSSIRSHLGGGAVSMGHDVSEKEIEQLAEYSFERYYSTAALFGTVAQGQNVIAKVAEAGVNEVACLLDFGVDSRTVLHGLPYLKELKDRTEKLGVQ